VATGRGGANQAGWSELKRVPGALLRYLGGRAVSDVGSGFYRLALPWAMYDATHSAALMGLLAAVEYVPVVGAPWFGVLADRLQSGRLSLLVAVAQAATALALAHLWWVHALDAPAVVAGGLLLAALSWVSTAANAVVVRTLTPLSARLAVNSLNETLYNASYYVSPALGGLVIAHAGIGPALFWCAAAYLIRALTSVSISFSGYRSQPLASGARGILRDAWVAVRKVPVLSAVLLAVAVWNFTWGGAYALEVYLFRDNLHLNAVVVGLVGTVAGVVPMALSVSSPWIVRHLAAGWVVLLTLVLSGLGMMGLAASRNALAACGSVSAMDGAVGPESVVETMLMQQVVPREWYGRITGFALMATGVGFPAGALLAGLAAAAWGARWALLLMGASVMTAAALLWWRSPLPQFRIGSAGPTVAGSSRGDVAASARDE